MYNYIMHYTFFFSYFTITIGRLVDGHTTFGTTGTKV